MLTAATQLTVSDLATAGSADLRVGSLPRRQLVSHVERLPQERADCPPTCRVLPVKQLGRLDPAVQPSKVASCLVTDRRSVHRSRVRAGAEEELDNREVRWLASLFSTVSLGVDGVMKRRPPVRDCLVHVGPGFEECFSHLVMPEFDGDHQGRHARVHAIQVRVGRSKRGNTLDVTLHDRLHETGRRKFQRVLRCDHRPDRYRVRALLAKEQSKSGRRHAHGRTRPTPRTTEAPLPPHEATQRYVTTGSFPSACPTPQCRTRRRRTSPRPRTPTRARAWAHIARTERTPPAGLAAQNAEARIGRPVVIVGPPRSACPNGTPALVPHLRMSHAPSSSIRVVRPMRRASDWERIVTLTRASQSMTQSHEPEENSSVEGGNS